jgi:hypothetical protein
MFVVRMISHENERSGEKSQQSGVSKISGSLAISLACAGGMGKEGEAKAPRRTQSVDMDVVKKRRRAAAKRGSGRNAGRDVGVSHQYRRSWRKKRRRKRRRHAQKTLEGGGPKICKTSASAKARNRLGAEENRRKI